ncbi:hypothetical protein Esti_002679 [Eimeria stiedai]
MQRLQQQGVLFLPSALLLLLSLQLCLTAEALAASPSPAGRVSLAAAARHPAGGPPAAARGPACGWLARVKHHPRGSLSSAGHSSSAAATDRAGQTLHLSSAANKHIRTKPSAAAATAAAATAAAATAAAAGSTSAAAAAAHPAAAAGPGTEEDDDADINVEYVADAAAAFAAALAAPTAHVAAPAPFVAAVAAALAAAVAVCCCFCRCCFCLVLLLCLLLLLLFGVVLCLLLLLLLHLLLLLPNPCVSDVIRTPTGAGASFSHSRLHCEGSTSTSNSGISSWLLLSLEQPVDYPFVAPPRNLVVDENIRVKQQQQQQQQQQQRVAAYHAQHPSSSSSRRGKRVYIASELLQNDEPDLVVKGEHWDDDFEVYTDHSLTERVDVEPADVHTDLLEYEKLYRGLGPWPSASTAVEEGLPRRKTIKTIAEAMIEEEKWATRDEQQRHEWVLDKEEEELLEPRVCRVYRNLKQHFNPDTRERFARFAGEGFVSAEGPLPLLELNQKAASPAASKGLFFLDASYAYANPLSPSGADMGQIDDPLDAPWRRRAEEVIRQVVAYGWPPKVRRAFSGFTLLDCSWEQQRLLLPLQPQQQQHSSVVTAQDLRRILQMIKRRLQDLADLESLPLLDAFDIQVAAVPTPAMQQQQQKQQRLELVGRRELTMAAGSWVSIHYASPEAAAAVIALPRAAAAAALTACARMHAATAAAEGAAAGQSLLQQLLQYRQQPLPPIEEEDARDYIRPMGASELSVAAADSARDTAAAPAYAVAAAANRLSLQAVAPSVSFLKRAVASSRQQQQQRKEQRGEREQQQQEQQPCLLLGTPNATCLFYARGGEVFLTSLDAVEKASPHSLFPCLPPRDEAYTNTKSKRDKNLPSAE